MSDVMDVTAVTRGRRRGDPGARARIRQVEAGPVTPSSITAAGFSLLPHSASSGLCL